MEEEKAGSEAIVHPWKGITLPLVAPEDNRRLGHTARGAFCLFLSLCLSLSLMLHCTRLKKSPVPSAVYCLLIPFHFHALPRDFTRGIF